eukprot:TRINITY_DN11294_c0_g2_i2.p1 TRINITY_DN11294_c0_g2~~TRINITY_DN11294_c0_g2_i2.p1  ORF type:complete len:850 (-),score=199.94 TRINITY_DN11294_c0_g2_i2:37-2586(-)
MVHVASPISTCASAASTSSMIVGGASRPSSAAQEASSRGSLPPLTTATSVGCPCAQHVATSLQQQSLQSLPGQPVAGAIDVSPGAASPTTSASTRAAGSRDTRREPAACTSEAYAHFKRSVGLAPDVRLYVIRGNPHGADLSQVRRAIESSGLVENVWDPDGQFFDLQWGARDRVDFGALASWQRASNYERCREITTKSGLAEHLVEAGFWADIDPDTFSARTFVCNSSGAIEQFALEFKVSKALCLLKAWVSHLDAGGCASETFPEGVVRTALAVVRRRWTDIDMLLDSDENEAEQVDFEVRDDEWEILAEADFDKPAAPSLALERQARLRAERRRARRRTSQLVQRRIAELQQQGARRREQDERRQRERARLLEQRRQLAERVLRQSASAAALVTADVEGDVSLCSSPAGSPCRRSLPARSSSSPSLLRPRSLASLPSRSSGCGDEYVSSPAATFSPVAAIGDGGGAFGGGESDDDDCVELVEGPSGAALVAAAREQLAERQNDPQFAVSDRNIWILKPAGRLRGQGIFLEDDLDQICKHVRHTKDLGIRNSYVVQRYVENPLLIGGTRKHDIRQWVAVTSADPLTVWFFSESYVRLAANEYSLDDIHDQFAHLNNNAINCLHENYDPDDEYWRCQWGLPQYRRLLRAKYGYDVYAEKLLPAMKRIVMASLECVRASLAEPTTSGNSFQLLGYDFLVDSNLNVWLLEVNGDPLMHASCEVTERLCEPCLKDLIRVAVDGRSGGGPEPHFELLYRGTRLPELRPEAYRQVPIVEGVHLSRPSQATAMLQSASIEDPKVMQQRLKAQRICELQDLMDRRRQSKEKEMQNRERQSRLKQALRAKHLTALA